MEQDILENPTELNLRPPAVPLIVNDPYLSVWSASDELTGSQTTHWTGAKQSLGGLIRIDGKVYRYMGTITKHYGFDAPAMTQVKLDVLPTRTIYQFEADNVRLILTFMTPSLPHNLEIMSRPVTYVEFQVESLDRATHDVDIYFDIGANLVINIPQQDVVWGRNRLSGSDVLWMGSREQDILGKSGDDLRIDWGYLYSTTAADVEAYSALGDDVAIRRAFVATGTLPDSDDFDMPRSINERPPMPVSAWAFDLGAVQNSVSRYLVLAYDDQFSVEYMHRKLRPYWRQNDMTAPQLLQSAVTDYAKLKKECEDYDADLMADLTSIGGEKYARLAALAFRQCIAAHKLVVDVDGTPLFFSKENFSNGCMGTVDITYPSSPFFLLLNPNLLEAQLTPILDYSMSPLWKLPFAPHDVGRYPIANGQVYGGGGETDFNQMPIEECGNMLIMLGALSMVGNNTDYAQKYWSLLQSWADYLVENGLDPENQLCTDDFAGHLAHNVNLSLKAIAGIASFAKMADLRGMEDEARQYFTSAQQMAQEWLTMAEDGDHYRLTFDKAGTWSQKYNLVWDKLLEFNLFPKEVAEKEIAYYKTKQAQYGLPLDNRNTYTKLDWIVWSASLSDKEDDFQTFINPVFTWLNETESRVALTDWYYTDTGKHQSFVARAVVGGVFIKMLYDADVWQKWRSKA